MRSAVLLLITLAFVRFDAVEVRLVNPSFEDDPQDATVPTGWMPCAMGTTPDILPGSWGVYTRPSKGRTYMGLITRADGTHESVGQRLAAPLDARECYSFSLDLAHSNTYSGYNAPIRLRIYGSRTRCAKDQLLAETATVSHTTWRTYDFTFTPAFDLNYIILEAAFADGTTEYYRGNILLDNCSMIKQCDRA